MLLLALEVEIQNYCNEVSHLDDVSSTSRDVLLCLEPLHSSCFCLDRRTLGTTLCFMVLSMHVHTKHTHTHTSEESGLHTYCGLVFPLLLPTSLSSLPPALSLPPFVPFSSVSGVRPWYTT